jgi:hypothetical protein
MIMKKILSRFLMISSLLLSQVQATDTGVTTNVDTITFEYKILNKKECKRLFKTKKILKKGYQPIQITLTNHSDHAIVVSPKGLNIPTIPADTVLTALHKNGFARGVPLGLVGVAAGLPLPMALLLPPVVAAVSGLCVITFFTAGIFAGVGARMYNKKITIIADLELQSEVVLPHTAITGIVFIKSDSLISDVTLLVKNQNSQELLTLSSNF